MEIANLKEHAEFIPTMAVWHHDQWGYLNPGGSVEKRIFSLEAELESDEIPKTFVAVSGEKLLGSASLIPHDMKTRMELTPWLASVFVDPELREKGIGSALVRHVVKEAGSLNYRTIYLYTPDRMVFYEGLGWTFIERADQKGHQVDIMMIGTV